MSMPLIGNLKTKAIIFKTKFLHWLREGYKPAKRSVSIAPEAVKLSILNLRARLCTIIENCTLFNDSPVAVKGFNQ